MQAAAPFAVAEEGVSGDQRPRARLPEEHLAAGAGLEGLEAGRKGVADPEDVGDGRPACHRSPVTRVGPDSGPRETRRDLGSRARVPMDRQQHVEVAAREGVAEPVPLVPRQQRVDQDDLGRPLHCESGDLLLPLIVVGPPAP